MPVLAACGSVSSRAVTDGPVQVSLWTHDPGYIKTFRSAVGDDALMRGSRFDYRMRFTDAAGSDVVTRMMAQAVADGNTPDLAGVIIDQFPQRHGCTDRREPVRRPDRDRHALR
ncbi:hypothetical protein [Streptomyces caelestis]|uniref:hypothetical protein n=1 Tax=Streptomyces caelestis TaxID=36816 RepID=UPI00365030C2